MKHPNGNDLLKTLIDLYAEQNGAKITYQTKTKENGNDY